MHIYSEAVEFKLSALSYSVQSMRDGYERGHEYRRIFGQFERYALKNADSFWWSHEIAAAVLQSSVSLPSDALVSQERLSNGKRLGWWWFEKPLHIEGFEPFQALLWFVGNINNEPAISATTYGFRDSQSPEALDTIHLNCEKPLEQIEKDMSGVSPEEYDRWVKAELIDAPPTARANNQRLLLRFFVGAMLWVQQSIVVPTKTQLARHAQKRIAGAPDDFRRELNIVVLRRRQAEAHSEGNNEPVEWSCRWIVSGHWRNQYHPSTGERVPTWILPYIKGPEDKPLKEPGGKIYIVTR